MELFWYFIDSLVTSYSTAEKRKASLSTGDRNHINTNWRKNKRLKFEYVICISWLFVLPFGLSLDSSYLPGGAWMVLVWGNSRENRKDVLFYKSQPKKNFTWNYLIIYLIMNLSIIHLEKLTNPSLTFLKLIISFSVLVKNSEGWSTCSYRRVPTNTGTSYFK